MSRRRASLLALVVSLGEVALAGVGGVLAMAAPSSVAAQAASGSLGDAEAALSRGELDAAEAGFRAVTTGATLPRARMGLARTLVLRARYDEAARAAHEAVVALERAPASSSDRIAAITLEGEVLALEGRLDEAQAGFERVRSEPTAHRARVMLGRLLQRRGRDAEARPVLMSLVQAYNDETIGERDAEGLAYVGMAAAMLGSAHDANDAFTQSSRVDRRRVETQLEWAELYLAHHDAGHAEECLRDALAVTQGEARAFVLAARIALAQGFDFARAREALDRAEALAPELPAIHVLRASLALRSLSFAEADAELDRALATDPTSREALAMRAAVRFLAEDPRGMERAVQAVLALDPTYADVYTTIAEQADWEHRYPEIVRLSEEALRIAPTDARAMSTRGINLLREGREDEGLTQLRQAFRRDRFDVRVYNILNLYDDVIGPHYQWVDGGRPGGTELRFRFHEDERPVLAEVVVPVLSAAFDGMRSRYRFTPHGPVSVELYATPQHFSVRTEGLPNLGVQGVCFGQVVTALSPRAGAFDWAQITTHELAHVFHIQLSQNRVPRWFTEGLAEHETVMARPEWRRENDGDLARVLVDGSLPPLARLNEAFTHARSAEAVMTAYYAASRVVGYLVDRFGFAVMPQLLRGWGEGRSTEDVVQRVLHVSIDALDHDWRQAELARLAPRLAHVDVDLSAFDDLAAHRAAAAAAPQDAASLARYGAALLVASGRDAGQRALAESTLRQAVRFDPHEPTARMLLAQLALEAHQPAEALVHIDALVAPAGTHDGPAVRILEARAALALEQVPRARAALERATELDPERTEAFQGLASIAEQTHDEALTERVLARIVQLDQHDRHSLGELVLRHARAARWDDVVALADRVRFLDPENAELVLAVTQAMDTRARSLDARGLREVPPAERDALVAWSRLALAAAREGGPELALARVLRVDALRLARRAREARAFATEARAADASLGAALDAALAGTPLPAPFAAGPSAPPASPATSPASGPASSALSPRGARTP